MIGGICKLMPDKCKDVKTGKEYDSLLFKDLSITVDDKTAWSLYYNIILDTSLTEKYPWIVKDHLGQPTLESLKNVDWVAEILDKQKLNKESALEKANKQYGIRSTENFVDIANRIGALERNSNTNLKYTTKITRGELHGKKVYTLEVVPKTAKNEIALSNFLELQSYRDRLITMASKAGIGIEVVNNLTDDVSGLFDNRNPERVFNDIFNLIRINANKDIGELTLATCEEIGHTIAAIYEGNELTKDLYNRFANLIYQNRHKLTDILTKEDITEIENTDRVNAECVGKVIGYVLNESKGKVLNTGNEFSRGFARLINSTINIGRKIFRGICEGSKSTIATALNVLSDNRLFNNDNVTPLKINELQYAIRLEILTTARQMSNSFINKDIAGEQALRIKQKVNRETRAYSDLAGKVTTAYEDFLMLMEKHDMIDSKTISVLKLHVVNARRKYLSDKKSKFSVVRNPAEENYFRAIYGDLASVLLDLQNSFTTFTLDFTTMCSEALREGGSNYDMLEASITIASLPEQLSLLNKGRLTIQLISQLNDAYRRNDLHITDTERDNIGEIMSSLDGMVENIKNIYYRLSKGAFVAQMIVINNGLYYIDRGARMMQIADENGNRKLQSYKGRRIYLSELVSELDTSDGYFDMSWWGLNMQKAGNSVDPITLLLDLMTKTNKFNANRENLRWLKTILDLRERCKELTGSYDVSFMFERDAEGRRTGNIRQRTKWGLWEAEYEAEKNYWYEKFKKDFADELLGMTNFERSLFLLNHFLEHYNEWHKANSLWTELATDEELPDMWKINARDEKVRKPNIFTNRIGDDILLELQDGLEYTSMKFIPNPNAFDGKYYDASFDTDLTEGQKKFIEEYLELKAQLDSKVNKYKTNATTLYRLPLFRGIALNRFSTEGFLDTTKSSVMESIFEDMQDEDFGDISSYNTEDGKFMPGLSKSIKEIRSRIPTFGINKLKNIESLDTDIFRSTMAYAVMANNVECMATTSNVAQLGLDVLLGRSIEGTTELQRAERGKTYSNIYQRFEKYVEMQVFGLYATMNSIPFAKNKLLSLQKITRKLSKATSWLLLAGKITGGNVNTGTGLWQIVKEACVGEHFTMSLFAKALEIYSLYGLLSNFAEGFAANMRTNPLYRFVAYMDAQNKNADKFRKMSTDISQIFRMNYAMCWYENGDHIMQTLPYIMKALNTKLYRRKDGKYEEVGNMWEVFEKACKEGSFKGETDSVVETDDTIEDTGWGNPFSYEDTVVDEETGKTYVVRRNYYIQTEKSKQEFITSGLTPAGTFEKRIAELLDEIDLKNRLIESLKASSPTTYLEEREYKRHKRDLEILESQLSKYLDLLETGNYTIADGDFDEFNFRAQARFQDACRDLCTNMHGIYNSLDAVAISQSVFGAMALTMKKFYLGYANNAWLTSRDSLALLHDVEGYSIAMGKVLRTYLFTQGTDRNVDARVATALLSMTAGIVGSAFMLGALHSLIASGLCNLLTIVSSKLINNESFRNKMISDGFSTAQSKAFKRAFTLMYLQIAFSIFSKLFQFSNYKFLHSDDDDDKEDKQTEETEWIIEKGADGKEYRRKKVAADESPIEKKIKNMQKRMQSKLNKFKGKEIPKPVNYSDYSLDDAILKYCFGIEDYSNRAFAFSGGEKHLKTPGILSTLLLTEKDEKTGKWGINKGSREDWLGLYKTIAMANYFFHRWEYEQAVFSPTFAASNPTNFLTELKTLKSEVLQGIAPVAMSHTLEMMASLLDFSSREQTYPHDADTEGWNWEAYDYVNKYPKQEIYNLPWLDRTIYKFNNWLHTVAGDRVFSNYFFNNTIYLNVRPFLVNPEKAQHTWDFQRSSR